MSNEIVEKAISTATNSAVAKGGEKVIEELFNTFVRPRINKLKNRPKCTEDIIELLEEYLENAYNRNKYINTIVFKKETKTIDELYIPLTIVKNGKNCKEKILINDEVYNFFETKSRILLIDNAGMGKSTLVKYIYLHCLKKKYGIPFLIELRKLQGKSLLQYIGDEICLCEKELNTNDIKFLIERGDFIFFLDGFDEIPNEEKEFVAERIRGFILEFSQNKYMLTSREDEYINLFNEFVKHHIRPLEKSEAYELIKKYDQNGGTSQELIFEIENHGKYEVLKEFLGNPLMVSLLYSSYSYKGIIQYKKHLFYRQVYDALYEGHDIIKGSSKIHSKKSKLDIEDFNGLLSALGYISIKKGKVSFDKIEIYEMIKKAVELYKYEMDVEPKDFLSDILYSVPMLIEEGLSYKWIHKSFAEYYAAYFICCIEKKHEYQIIESMMESKNNINYHNVLDFCYDMDNRLAKEVIVYNTLSSYLHFCDSYEMEFEIEQQKSNSLKELVRYYDFIDSFYLVKMDDSIVNEKNKVNVDIFCEAYEMFKGKCEEEMSEFYIISKNFNVILFICHTVNYENALLLFDKNIDIYKNIKMQEYNMKFFEDMKSGVYKVKECKDLKDGQKLNALVSYIHHRNFSMDRSILDYEKCLKLKEKIKKEMNNEQEDIFNFSQ